MTKPKILIIDDEKYIHDQLKTTFEDDYDFDSKYDSKTGLIAIEKTQYDLILLDMELRKGEGLEGLNLLTKIHKANPSIPIIAISGVDILEDTANFEDTVLTLGAKEFLRKRNFRPETWKDLFDKAIEERKKYFPKLKVLFTTANPAHTTKLRLEEEYKKVKNYLSSTTSNNLINIVHQPITRKAELATYIINERPNIIHFAGHSSAQGLELEDGKLTPNDINFVFGALAKHNIPCLAVVFNSCNSFSLGKIVNNYVPYMIGTQAKIGDEKAINFAFEFYKKLNEPSTIEEAYHHARNLIPGVGSAKSLLKMIKNKAIFGKSKYRSYSNYLT